MCVASELVQVMILMGGKGVIVVKFLVFYYDAVWWSERKLNCVVPMLFCSACFTGERCAGHRMVSRPGHVLHGRHVWSVLQRDLGRYRSRPRVTM